MNIIKHRLKNIFLFAGTAALLFAACESNDSPGDEPTPLPPAPGSKAKAIPLYGNTHIMDYSGSEISAGGITGWANQKKVYSAFFRTRNTGSLSIFLVCTSDGASEVKLTVGHAPEPGTEETFNGTPFTLAIPKSLINRRDGNLINDTVFVCTLDNCEVGYQRIDFQGVSRTGEFFATAKSLIVDGEAADKMNFVPTSAGGRLNGPSVHLGYEYPYTDTAEWFYNEVAVPDGMDPPASYFMVCGFDGGYFGIQPQPTATTENPKLRVLFSVWAPYKTDHPETIPDSLRVAIMKGGDGVKIQMFGGEGSGTQTFISTDDKETPTAKQVAWKTGTTYKCLARIYPSRDVGFTDYEASDYIAYFYDPAPGKGWRLMAWLRRPKTTLYYIGAHSFVENFSGVWGYLTRKACFGNQWIRLKNGTWKELTSGHFNTDATGNSGHRLDLRGGVENGKFFLQNSGFFSIPSTPGEYFYREPTGTPPEIDFAELEALLQ